MMRTATEAFGPGMRMEEIVPFIRNLSRRASVGLGATTFAEFACLGVARAIETRCVTHLFKPDAPVFDKLQFVAYKWPRDIRVCTTN